MEAWPTEVDTVPWRCVETSEGICLTPAEALLTTKGKVGKSIVTERCPGVAVGLNSTLVSWREERLDFVFISSPAVAGEHVSCVLATSALPLPPLISIAVSFHHRITEC